MSSRPSARTAAFSVAAVSLLVSSTALAERQVGVDVSVGVGVGPAAPPPAPPPPAPAPGPVYQPAPAPGPVYSATPAPAGQGAWVPPPPAVRREYEHKVLTLDINPFAMMRATGFFGNLDRFYTSRSTFG